MQRFLISLLLVAFSAVPARAADFEIVNLEPIPLHEVASGDCNVKMTGAIAPGDAEKLFEIGRQLGEAVGANEALQGPDLRLNSGLILFSENQDVQMRARASLDDTKVPRFNAICLSSKGGSMEEALKIIREVMTFGFVTVVPENASCFSACAFIFLAGDVGLSSDQLGEIMPYRVMHASAAVGFHTPSARFDPRLPPLPLEELNKQLSLAYTYLRDFDAFFIDRDTVRPESRFSKDLYAEVLRHIGPDNFYMIDTIDKAGRFNIRIAGTPSVPVTEASLARLCSNNSTWRRSLAPPLMNDLRFNSYALFQGEDEYSCGNEECEVDPGTYRVESSVFRCEVVYSPSEYGDDFLTTTKYVGSSFRGAAYYSSESWASFPHYYPLNLVATQNVLRAGAQSPYLIDGLASNIFEPRRVGTGTLITGFERETSAPFGMVIWFSGEGNFFWLDDQAGIQSDLHDIELKPDEQKICIYWGNDNRSVCSSVVCQTGSGCIFRPDDGQRSLDGFPYLARPIFFNPSDNLVEISFGVTPSVVLPKQ